MQFKTINPPLPFWGNKKKMSKLFQQVILDNFDETNVYIDLFGGAGVLSKSIKTVYPTATVIYNDFDGYRNMCQHVDVLNVGLAIVKNTLVEFDQVRYYKINQECRQMLITQLSEWADLDNADLYYSLIISKLSFRNTSINIKDKQQFIKALNTHILYNNLCKVIYDVDNCMNYHKDLIIKNLDFRLLINEFKDNQKAVFIADPPYTESTDSNYKNSFKLIDSLILYKDLKELNSIIFCNETTKIIDYVFNKCFFKEGSIAYESKQTFNPHGLEYMIVNK
jgi:hypothetical protein